MSVFFTNLGNPQNANTGLCFENDTTLSVGAINADIDRLTTQLDAGKRISIYCQSTRLFMIALAAVWRAGSTAILPATDKSGYLDEIGQQFDTHLDDARIQQLLIAANTKPVRATPGIPPATSCQAIFFTSGSSGTPKPVIKTLAQIEDEITIQSPLWRPLMGDYARIIGLVSHQHIYGLIFRVIWPVMTKQVTCAQQAQFWDMVLGEMQTGDMLVASPAQLKNLHPDLATAPRPALVLSSGGPLDFAAAQSATAMLGVCPTEIYGSTETGGIAWRQQRQENAPWHPLPQLETGLNDAGCLRVRAPHIAGTDWYQTEDRAMLDREKNCFVLKGRADRVVKIGGKRVSLGAVEEHLRRNELIEDAVALLAREDDPRLAVVAVLTPDGKAELEKRGRFRMGRLLRRELSKFEEDAALPQRWRFVDRLPTDSQGKKPLHLLRALFDDNGNALPEVTEPVRNQERDAVSLTLKLDGDMTCFKGHFPGHPILPGVIQLHWAALFGASVFGSSRNVAEVSQLKFRKPITPSDVIRLELDFDASAHRLKFSYRSDQDDLHSSGTLKLRVPQDDGAKDEREKIA